MMNIKDRAADAIQEVSKIIVGKERQIGLILAAVFSSGHVLLDDLPGVGKTTLAKVMSHILGCEFSRVQFTPDLLPSDVTGLSVYDQKIGDFRVRTGPIMTNVFLADEINRAIPRTQSALLEAMEELQVTIDGQTMVLPQPFTVLATQNPVESESTFRLPAAQMDRFMIRLSLGYPSEAEEATMLRIVGDDIPFGSLSRIFDAEEIVAIREEIKKVAIADSVVDYIVAVVTATRNDPRISLPASPRGSRALFRGSKALAAIHGRDYVTPSDVKEFAPYALPHRIILSSEAQLESKTADALVEEILDTIPVPVDEREIIGATGH